MKNSQILQALFEKTGMTTTAAAEAAGISRAMLSKLCRKGELCRVAHGQYALPQELPDELYSISLRSATLVFSHETALYLHGISDRTPLEHTITIPSGVGISPALQEQCKVYRIKRELVELGRTEMPSTFGNLVPCYDLERTICDVIRSRNRIGTETFHAALKQYASHSGKNLVLLNEYAMKLGVSGVVRHCLEVLL